MRNTIHNATRSSHPIEPPALYPAKFGGIAGRNNAVLSLETKASGLEDLSRAAFAPGFAAVYTAVLQRGVSSPDSTDT